MCHFGLKNGVTVRLGSTKVSAPAHIPRAEARAKDKLATGKPSADKAAEPLSRARPEPEAEETAQVRRFSRLFVTAQSMTVPFVTVVLRKGYGLGAQAMAGGSFRAPLATLSWPTGEFGAMGLEGAVRLGFRKELEALPEGAERDALFQKLVAKSYANGEAMHMAATLEIDAVIDPADTRAWLARGLASARVGTLGPRFVDTW